MIHEILQAFILIFMAEMGDKTQILAIAFASRYPVKKVLLGVAIGAFLNHGIAVALGSQLTRIVPMNTIQIVAGIAFVIFGIWSLRVEEDDGEAETSRGKYGAVTTVALAFFIGELGDKTQLAAITLAAGSSNILLVLMGTVSGMVATSCLGIYVGKKIGDRIPEIGIKAVAALIFLFFGSVKLYTAVPKVYINPTSVIFYLLAVTFVFAFMFRKSYVAYKSGPISKYRKVSKRLHDYYADMEVQIEKLCNGKGICGECDGTKCPVGNTKALIHVGLSGDVDHVGPVDEDVLARKKFKNKNIDEIIEATAAAKDLSDGHDGQILDKIINNLNKINSKNS